jgi:hypothetical protein
MFFRALPALATWAAVSMLMGCSSDSGPPLSTAGTKKQSGGGSQSPDSGSATPPPPASGGTLAVTDGGVCAALAPKTLITQQQVAQAAPTPTGGTIAPGTYALTAMNKYTGSSGATGPTTKIQAELYELDSSTYQHAVAGQGADAGALGSVFLDSGDYTLTNTTYTRSTTCGVGGIPISYSASNSGLKLLFLDEEYVFTLQP